jgi:AcrR family transcriptional regulator
MPQDPGKNPARRYRSATRDAARRATHDRIVLAAERLLEHEGWANFSVEAVARAAEVTRLTVYNQFGARRALLEAVFDSWAERGGMAGLAPAMSIPDPHVALARVVEIFCGFWSSHHGLMQGVLAAAMSDPEFAVAMRTRNERRRQLLSVLVGRMAKPSATAGRRNRKLVATLFALTSFAFHAELSASALTPAEARETIGDLAAAAVSRHLAAARVR